MTKILFLLKKNSMTGAGSDMSRAGLMNSSQMSAIELQINGFADTDIAYCEDGNSIDREVTKVKPDIAILEAIWATPAKLRELTKLHPKVTFVIRIHSEIPFLAYEGVAMEWIKEFSTIEGVEVAFNSSVTVLNFVNILSKPPLYLPNIFEQVDIRDINIFRKLRPRIEKPIPDIVNIGCFGAIRPMKNQLLQAFAAIQFGNSIKKPVRFHMNVTRVEDGSAGHNVLRNLRALFKDNIHKLVEHAWLPRLKFLNIVETMDVGMQVSMTESFNIVAADFVSQKVPIVVSPTIDWMPEDLMADPESVSDVAHKLRQCFKYRTRYEQDSRLALNRYNNMALATWLDFIKTEK